MSRLLLKYAFPKSDNQRIHTHTWFGHGEYPKKISITDANVISDLRERLFEHVQSGNTDAKWNSLTEFIPKNGIVRMFADLDFKPWQFAGMTEQAMKNLMIEVIKLYKSTIDQCIGRQLKNFDWYCASRMGYKLHLHFPTVIVTTETAKSINETFRSNFQNHDTLKDIYDQNVVDSSVYKSGLRMLWCKKGLMESDEKYQENRAQHESTFPDLPYEDMYSLVNIQTLDRLPFDIHHLEDTSIHTSSEVTDFYEMQFVAINEKSSPTLDAKPVKTLIANQNVIAQLSSTDLTFIAKHFEQTTMEDVSWNWYGEEGNRGHKLVPDCMYCLVQPGHKHSHVGHSCMYINEKTVILSCYSHSTRQLDKLSSTEIINNFYTYILKVQKQSQSSDPTKDRESTFHRLKERMLEHAEVKSLKRDENGEIYRPLPATTYAYTRYMSPKDWLNEIFMDDPMFNNDVRYMDQLIKWIHTYSSRRFPFYKRDMHVIGFQNGIFDLVNLQFTLKEDVSNEMIVRQYYDMQASLNSLDTPLFDSIIKYQFPDEGDTQEVYQIFLAFVGRLFFKVNEYDNWQVMMYLFGVPHSGKSTLMTIIQAMFKDIGAIDACFENKFGLSSLLEKEVIIIDDLPDKITDVLDQTTFQKMVGGTSMNIPVKFGTAKTVNWPVPMIIGGNNRMNYNDKGQISRRVVEFAFEKAVVTGDSTLARKIIEKELGNLIIKCARAYRTLLDEHGSKTIWEVLPKYFIKTREALMKDLNPFVQFIADSPRISAVAGCKTKASRLRELYSEYSGKPARSKLDLHLLQQINPAWLVKKLMVCKACGQECKVGCCDRSGQRTTADFIMNMQIDTDQVA